MDYILRLEEEPLSRNGRDAVYRAKGFNTLVFDENGLRKLIPLTEEQLKRLGYVPKREVEKAYEKGRKDGMVTKALDVTQSIGDWLKGHEAAKRECVSMTRFETWQAAKLIALPDHAGRLTFEELHEIFGTTFEETAYIMDKFTADEAIEKIRAWRTRKLKERQKQEAENEEIRQWDGIEVAGIKGVCSHVEPTIDGTTEYIFLLADGSICICTDNEVRQLKIRRTGEHFDGLSGFLERMPTVRTEIRNRRIKGGKK